MVTVTQNYIEISSSEDSDEEFYKAKTPIIRRRTGKVVVNPENPMKVTIKLKNNSARSSSSSEEVEEIISIMPIRKSNRNKKQSLTLNGPNNYKIYNTRKSKSKDTELIDLCDSGSSPEKQRKISEDEEEKELIGPTMPQKPQNVVEDNENETGGNLNNNLQTPIKRKISEISKRQITNGSPENKFKTPEKNNENVPKTPSSMLKDLSLTSPLRSKKKLFKETAYQSAKKALHNSFPANMVCREKELGILRNFINEHLENESSGSLYVSGPPGTGKTASLNIILEQREISSEMIKIYVNCTTMLSSGSIFSRIVKELKIKNAGKSEKEYRTAIENYLGRKHKMILLVLDEMDQLESKNQNILYTIFEWPARPGSKLILIGIANALDLTDRILPRLQSRCELKPELLHFAPYNKDQIVDIIKSRLQEAQVTQVFNGAALQMVARKVAAVSGDVRRALDIARRAVEIVQNENVNVLTSIENVANELMDDEEKNNSKIVKAVDLKEVVNVLNNVYNTTQMLNENENDTLPLQQKIIVCTLLLMLKKNKIKNVTIGKLHQAYNKICTKQNIMAVDQGEFVGICCLIEAKGIIKVGKGRRKEPTMYSVTLEWDEEEIVTALKDKRLLSSILEDN